MPLRNSRALSWKFHGCSDAIDGTNAFRGAMLRLRNLVPSSNTADQWVPRPARDFFSLLSAWSFYDNPTVVQNFTVVGNRLFGFMTTNKNPGHDEPICIDLETGRPITVSGIDGEQILQGVLEPGNTPTTAPTIGRTQKPLFAKVGQRIVATHPGFPGGLYQPSGLTITFTANATIGSRNLTGLFGGQIYPGMMISDTGGAVPAPPNLVRVVSTFSVDFIVTASGTAGFDTFAVSDASQIQVGQMAAGRGLSGFVTAVTGSSVTLSASLTETITSEAVSFHGDGLVMSQAALATAVGDTVTVETAGDPFYKFGWWDISSFEDKTHQGTIGGIYFHNITPTQINAGWQVGFMITDEAGLIGAGTAIYSVGSEGDYVQLSAQTVTSFNIKADKLTVTGPINDAAVVTGDTTAGGTLVVNLSQAPVARSWQAGMSIGGGSIPGGTTIEAVFNAESAVKISQPAGATTTGVPLTVIGTFVDDTRTADFHIGDPVFVSPADVLNVGWQPGLTISDAAGILPAGTRIIWISRDQSFVKTDQSTTLGAQNTLLTVLGGTPEAPQWAAGDTVPVELPSVPIGVGQLAGRAYYACGADGIPFSVSLLSGLRPFTSFALKPGNGLAVTHCVGQPLTTPITGGIIQSLYAFQGVSAIQQITGDVTTADLSINPLNIQTGTLAPATIVPTILGMAFMSPEGMRIIDFAGTVSHQLGAAGQGVTLPFINAVDPTRCVAAANGDTLRISVQNAATLGQPWEEWWYDLARKVWGGPHSLQTSAMAPWEDTFITAAQDVPAQLYKSPSFPSGFTDFEEDGATLIWQAATVLVPDTGLMAQNAVNRTTIGMSLPTDTPTIVEVFNEAGERLDAVVIEGAYELPVFGGLPVFGTGLWYGVKGFFSQYDINWHHEINFKQLMLVITGTSRFGSVIGDAHASYQILGYTLQPYPSTAMVVSIPALPGALLVNGSPLALRVAPDAVRGTVIGAVQVLEAFTNLAVFRPEITLVFNQAHLLALDDYSSESLTGVTNGSTTLAGLSSNALTEGWLPGHVISDDQGALLPGTYITAIAPDGLSVTLSQATRRSLFGVRLFVEGTNLVTDWTDAIADSSIVGEVRVIARRTAYFAHQLAGRATTVLTDDSGEAVLTDDSGAVILTP